MEEVEMTEIEKDVLVARNISTRYNMLKIENTTETKVM